MKISKAANKIELSLTRRLFNMAKEYDNVIDLTLGDPDVPPSEIIRKAASDAIFAGKTKYSANAGLLQFREAIAKNFYKEYGLKIDPTRHVMATVGGMEALYLGLACMVDEGDEVIIFAPYYVNYKQMIRICGGTPVIVNTLEENGYGIDEKQLEEAVTERTVAIIINTPSNPTGAVLSQKSLEAVANIAKKYDLTVISDEVYRTLIYDDVKHQSIINLQDMSQRTLLVDSLSKRFAMTGYRLGYAIGPEELISNMIKMQENIAACAPLPSQYAGIAAFEYCADDNSIVEEFQARRDYLYDAINTIDGLSCIKPAATFYLYVNIKDTGLDGQTFAYKLLESQQVAVVPGVTYGENYKNYFRIAYTMKIDVLKEAVERIRKFVDGIKNKQV